MSGSSKKKLRREQTEPTLTKKQEAARKEANQMKRYTLIFSITMILVVAIVLGVVITPVITSIINRNTHAVTFGEHELNTVEFSYFYMDEISSYTQEVYNQYYQTYGSMWQMFLLLNTNQPLNKQYYNEANNVTWADHFVDEAISTATRLYALYDEGKKNGFELEEDVQTSLDQYFASLEASAKNNGTTWNKQLEATYGKGASAETYKAYYTANVYASSYFQEYCDSLEYTNDQLREYEKDKYKDYTSYSYAYYPLSINSYLSFLGGGTKNENGAITYTDEQKAAALAAAKKDAEALINSGAKTTEELDAAIKKLDINKDNKNAASTPYEDVFYPELGTDEAKAWLSHADRKNGDMTTIEGKQTTTTADGTKKEEVTVLNVFLFFESNENLTKLVNVRHLLVAYENPYLDGTGNYVYSEATKKAAKEKATKFMLEWEKGDKTSESFAELANKNSADSDGTDGGLYERVYPGQMVESFNDWCFDANRKPGDIDVVETEYGAHVIYFEKTLEETYRDFLIKEDLIEKDSEAWLDALKKALNVEKVNVSGLQLDYTLAE